MGSEKELSEPPALQTAEIDGEIFDKSVKLTYRRYITGKIKAPLEILFLTRFRY